MLCHISAPTTITFSSIWDGILDQQPKYKCIAIFAIYCGLSINPSFADEQYFQAPQIRTAAVNSNGQRHDTERLDCLEASQGFVFEQVSFKTKIVHQDDADEATCTMSFSDYVEHIPGISEPRKACLRSFVKSVGGIFNVGKRGHLICGVHYKQRDYSQTKSDSVNRFTNKAPISNKNTLNSDAIAQIPTLPATLSLERKSRSLITATVPLALLQAGIDKSVQNQSTNDLPGGFKVTVMGSRFDSYSPGSFNLGYYVDVDVSGPIGARCEIIARFAIPPARLKELIVQEIGSSADCRTGSLLGQLANLPTLMNNTIRNSIKDALGKQLFGNSNTLEDWSKEDPELAEFMAPAFLQGSYCDWRGSPGLCLRVGWRAKDAIAQREAMLLARAPVATGSIDIHKAQEALNAFRTIALTSHMAEHNGIRFPSGFNRADGNEKIEDGDMGIFGGLLCRSGVLEGCSLIKNSYTLDGRFWRSPRRINEADTEDHATFSGDQLKGILHYFIETDDAKRLDGFLTYIRNKPTLVPNSQLKLEQGYSVCPNYAPNFTCFLSGADWYVLKLLATKHGLTTLLPSDLSSIEKRYGFSYDVLLWESLLTNNGYRLHLVANTAWILRSLGETDPQIAKAFAILASRERGNPFFQYLHLGADKKVQELTDQKCSLPIARNDFTDWAWQRAEVNEAWKRSMVWDCVFMYSLLVEEGKQTGDRDLSKYTSHSDGPVSVLNIDPQTK